MCQVAKDTRTNLKLSKTQADIWSYWTGQNGTLHLVAPVPACAISVGLFSQTQHFHIWAHHHCPGLGESSLPVSLPRECGPLLRQTDRRRRGETNTSAEKRSLRTNTQLTSDSKEIFLAGCKRKGLLVQRILAAAAAGSTSTLIPGACQHSWREFHQLNQRFTFSAWTKTTPKRGHNLE